MIYKNIKVTEVNIVLFLKDKDCKDWKANEALVKDWLRQNKIKASLENPIDDLVLIYMPFGPDNVDMELLSDIYRKAEKDFPEVKVNLFLDEFTEEGWNSIDLTLEEFAELPGLGNI